MVGMVLYIVATSLYLTGGRGRGGGLAHLHGRNHYSLDVAGRLFRGMAGRFPARSRLALWGRRSAHPRRGSRQSLQLFQGGSDGLINLSLKFLCILSLSSHKRFSLVGCNSPAASFSERRRWPRRGLTTAPLPALAGATRPTFSVSLLSASPEVFDLISWRLWDPLILAVGIPDIRAEAARECDLLLVTDRLGERRQTAKTQAGAAYEEGTRGVLGTSLADVLTALPGARGVIAVQTGGSGRAVAAGSHPAVRTGIRAVAGENPAGVAPHRSPVDPAGAGFGSPTLIRCTSPSTGMRRCARVESAVVTRLATGAPDIVMQGPARALWRRTCSPIWRPTGGIRIFGVTRRR